jgi:hypothetical protein
MCIAGVLVLLPGVSSLVVFSERLRIRKEKKNKQKQEQKSKE